MSPSPLFHDRQEAGERLAQAIQMELAQLKAVQLPSYPIASPVVFALPRGGLPVADPIATYLGCPLGIVVAKKITQPENPELAIGAVTAEGHLLWSHQVQVLAHQYPQSDPFAADQQEAQQKAIEQFNYFSQGCPLISPKGKLALVVDDGIATGMTMAVAVESLRARGAAAVWICAPVAPVEIMPLLEQWADRVIVLATPHPFYSVSRFYREFPQIETAIALAHLQRHCQPESFQSRSEDR